MVSEFISSQTKLHEAYGGVVPELASREHLANLPILVEKAMEGVAYEDLSLIAVTSGPGLKGCLLIGVEFAKGLSLARGIPIVGVNHIEGHIVSAQISNSNLKPPYLCLVVSGGHTEIVQVDGIGSYKLLCRTLDDAAGEAFDKAANLLGFSYPGGASLAKCADSCRDDLKSKYKLPRVMRGEDAFSFSGLKTAVLLLVKKSAHELSSEENRAALCWAVQEAIVDALIVKLKHAIKISAINTVSVSGGVSANHYLRAKVSQLAGVEVFFPGKTHCMDNASMIAYLGLVRLNSGCKSSDKISVLSRWPVEEMVK